MTTSLWQDEPGAGWPPLTGDTQADVAIVGAGIAGLTLALTVAREGASVVLLESQGVGAGASGRNAGFVLAGVAENFVSARRRYGDERAGRLWRFTLTNRVLLRALIQRHGIQCDALWNGSLQVAGSDEEWAEIQESTRLLAQLGVRSSLAKKERTALFEDDGELHPVRLVQGLAHAAAGLGARVHEGTHATGVTRDAVVTGAGTVRAGAVVVCAGAWTAQVLPSSRIVPIRGQMLATAPLDRRVFERPVYADRGYRYWRQTPEGRVVVGGWRDLAIAEETGGQDGTTAVIQGALDAFLRERGIDAPVTHRWAGTMEFSHDGLPYLGQGSDGIWIAGGFTGHGNGFAYAAAELLASLIRSGGHPDADLFDPQRP